MWATTHAGGLKEPDTAPRAPVWQSHRLGGGDLRVPRRARDVPRALERRPAADVACARHTRPRTPGARFIPRTERSARCGAGGGGQARACLLYTSDAADE